MRRDETCPSTLDILERQMDLKFLIPKRSFFEANIGELRQVSLKRIWPNPATENVFRAKLMQPSLCSSNAVGFLEEGAGQEYTLPAPVICCTPEAPLQGQAQAKNCGRRPKTKSTPSPIFLMRAFVLAHSRQGPQGLLCFTQYFQYTKCSAKQTKAPLFLSLSLHHRMP